MPNLHWANAAAPSAESLSIDALRVGLMQSTVTVLDASDNPNNLIGDVAGAILWQGRMFYYDASDTTTAQDGVSCVVTYDGRRYKVEAVGSVKYTVKDKDLTAPPSSPTLGDAYIVPVSPSGAWAAQASKIAIWTARGWLFITPFVGLLTYVQDEDGFYRYTVSGWSAGVGSYALSAGNIINSNLVFPFGTIVESTLNTPPAVTNGLAYIVGASPTGAWVGHSNKIAIGEGGAWVLYAPPTGAQVFDKSLGYEVCYKSGAWQVDRASGKYIGARIIGMTPTKTASITGTTVASTISYACAKSTNVLRFSLQNPQYAALTGSPNYYGIRKDTESIWRVVWDVIGGGSPPPTSYDQPIVFYLTPGDTASHDYKLYNMTCTTITIEEIEV